MPSGHLAGNVPIVRASGPESLNLALQALDGLQRRILAFEDRKTPYVSWAAPQFIGRFAGDYDHLARLWECALPVIVSEESLPYYREFLARRGLRDTSTASEA